MAQAAAPAARFAAASDPKEQPNRNPSTQHVTPAARRVVVFPDWPPFTSVAWIGLLVGLDLVVGRQACKQRKRAPLLLGQGWSLGCSESAQSGGEHGGHSDRGDPRPHPRSQRRWPQGEVVAAVTSLQRDRRRNLRRSRVSWAGQGDFPRSDDGNTYSSLGVRALSQRLTLPAFDSEGK